MTDLGKSGRKGPGGGPRACRRPVRNDDRRRRRARRPAGGPARRPQQRLQAWLGAAAAIAALLGVPAAVVAFTDWVDKIVGDVDVVVVDVDKTTPNGQPSPFLALDELSVDDTSPVDGVKTDYSGEHPVSVPETVQAPVIDLAMINRSDEVRLYTAVGVTVSRLVPVTDCASATGGPVGVSATYPIELPDVGQTAWHEVLFELPPQQTDRFRLVVGPADDRIRGIYLLTVVAREDSGDQVELARTVLSVPPTLSFLYQNPIHLLPVGEIPRFECVRELRKDIEEVTRDGDAVSREVEELLTRAKNIENELMDLN